MAYVLNFTELTTLQLEDVLKMQHKLAAIDALLAQLSDARAEAEAIWRKKENFLKTEQGKLQIALRGIAKGTLTETV